ncbi:hypothetical protein ABVT39_012704 [Epinephelus coioides]
MVEEVVEEEMEEEGDGRKAMDLASEWKENGWTHVESAGCHGGLLSEGHREYMKPTKLNEIFGGLPTVGDFQITSDQRNMTAEDRDPSSGLSITQSDSGAK